MLDTVFGLPVHPLVVHATVVVVPAAAASVFLAAVWPRFRRWAALLPLGLAVVGLVLDPLSTSSGESLEHTMGGSALIERHSELADGLLPWMLALTVLAAGLYVWHWRSQRHGTGRARSSGPRWVALLVCSAAAVAAVGTGVQVVRIGHSGAEAAWSGVAAKPSSSAAARP
jgi:hypothetical protein